MVTAPIVPLKRLFRIVSGSTPEVANPDYWDGDVTWVTPEDLGDLVGASVRSSRRTLTRAGLANSAATVVPPGAIILSSRAPIGSTAIAGAPLCTNQGCKALVLRTPGDPRYFYFQLLAKQEELRSLGRGSTFAEVSSDRLGSLSVVAPSPEVQSLVADFLEKRTAAIHELIAKKERLVALLQEKRQALITQAVTKGLDPGVPSKPSRVSWAGDLPTHWRELPIKRLARSGRGTFTDGDWIEAPYITGAGVRLLQTGNVGVGTYKEQGGRYISEATFDELRCTQLAPGDVMICRLDGPVGRACIAPDLGVRMVTSVDNAILKVSDEHDGRFVVYALSSPRYLEWVQALCRVGGGFRFRISRSMLGDFLVPVPPRHEQTAIANHLDAATTSSRETESRLAASITKLREYRQALITAAVTGQLDVTRERAS